MKLTDGVQVGRCRPSAGGRVQTASRGHSSSYMSYINHLETFVGGHRLLIFLTLKLCAVFCKLCVTNLIHVCVTHWNFLFLKVKLLPTHRAKNSPVHSFDVTNRKYDKHGDEATQAWHRGAWPTGNTQHRDKTGEDTEELNDHKELKTNEDHCRTRNNHEAENREHFKINSPETRNSGSHISTLTLTVAHLSSVSLATPTWYLPHLFKDLPDKVEQTRRSSKVRHHTAIQGRSGTTEKQSSWDLSVWKRLQSHF